MTGADDGVELGLELRRHLARGHHLRQPPTPGRMGAVGEHLGEPGDEIGQVVRVAALGAALQLDADDVEAPLHDPPQEREPGLHLLALGAHGAHLVHVARRSGRRGSPDRAARPGQRPWPRAYSRLLDDLGSADMRARACDAPSSPWPPRWRSACPSAACGGSDDGASGCTPVDSELAVGAEDSLKFDEDSYDTDAGCVEVTYTNDGSTAHNLLIEGESGFKLSVGDVDTGTVELAAGNYELYCDVAGHQAAGMVADLSVELTRGYAGSRSSQPTNQITARRMNPATIVFWCLSKACLLNGLSMPPMKPERRRLDEAPERRARTPSRRSCRRWPASSVEAAAVGGEHHEPEHGDREQRVAARGAGGRLGGGRCLGVRLAAGGDVLGVADHDLLVAPDHAPHVEEHRDAEEHPGEDRRCRSTPSR